LDNGGAVPSTRTGFCMCPQCRKLFTVCIGTVFEGSHVPLRMWLQAMFLIAGSKKGISSKQLHRTLGVTLKTASFMSHRMREVMRSNSLSRLARMVARLSSMRPPSACRKARSLPARVTRTR